ASAAANAAAWANSLLGPTTKVSKRYLGLSWVERGRKAGAGVTVRWTGATRGGSGLLGGEKVAGKGRRSGRGGSGGPGRTRPAVRSPATMRTVQGWPLTDWRIAFSASWYRAATQSRANSLAKWTMRALPSMPNTCVSPSQVAKLGRAMRRWKTVRVS